MQTGTGTKVEVLLYLEGSATFSCRTKILEEKRGGSTICEEVASPHGSRRELMMQLESVICWLNNEIDRLDQNRGFFGRDLILDWAIRVVVRAIHRREKQLADLAMYPIKDLLQ